MTAPIGYWHVDDTEQSLQQLVAAGATARQAIADAGGNVTGLVQ